MPTSNHPPIPDPRATDCGPVYRVTVLLPGSEHAALAVLAARYAVSIESAASFLVGSALLQKHLEEVERAELLRIAAAPVEVAA
jgi:hypothetical protein